jgi:hypothetical protein
MRRLLSDHAGDRAVLGEDADALGDEHGGDPAADAAEPQVALVVDVGDDQADLVDVAEHGHRLLAVRVDRRVAGAERVAVDVGEAGRVLAPDRGGLALVAGRPCGLEEVSEEGFGVCPHRRGRIAGPAVRRCGDALVHWPTRGR